VNGYDVSSRFLFSYHSSTGKLKTMKTPPGILENFTDSVFFLDRQGKVHWLNDAARKLFGIGAGKVPQTLAANISPSCLSQIIACKGSIVLTLDTQPPTEPKQFAIAVDSGLSDPDHELIQVTVKPTFALPKRQEEFLAMLAHDLKNPLGALFGYADALIDTPIGDSLSERQREVITRIRNTAARSLDLVRNFQYLACSADSFSLAKGSNSNLNGVIEAVAQDIWREELGAAKLTLELGSPPPTVQVERIALERLVANLLTNAQKFTPPDEHVQVKTSQEGNTTTLEITNSGPIISPQDLPKLFDRSFRGSNSSKVPGSGLGLFIVKQIVDGVGGSITVTSNKTNGTTFKVKLPK
jgi:signal transduction histidine kinase